jgi:hypothetical protein
MKANDIARVQDYLRRTFGNDQLLLVSPARPGAPVEVHLGDEFLGVLYRDEEDGEISYSLHMTILEMDLPPASPVTGKYE